MSDRPKVMLATASYDEGEVILRLEDKERTVVEFVVDPIGMAMLSLTLNPTLKLALADMKAESPEAERQGFPDTPEGL